MLDYFTHLWTSRVEETMEDNRHRRIRYPDWDCPDCNYENFGSNDKCKKCGLFRSKAMAKIGYKSTEHNKKRGDWNCICGYVNFADRQTCKKCNKVASIPVENGYKFREGDWFCESCKYPNWAVKDKCGKCGVEKESHSTTVTSTTQEPKLCIVCFTNPAEMCLAPCGHTKLCSTCSDTITTTTNKCPECRADIAMAVKIFA